MLAALLYIKKRRKHFNKVLNDESFFSDELGYTAGDDKRSVAEWELNDCIFGLISDGIVKEEEP